MCDDSKNGRGPHHPSGLDARLAPTPSPSSETPYTALLVMGKGPGRKSAARALRRAGCTVRAAREPYEGTARFVEQPSDLVVLSLENFRRRDAGFVSTVRKRAPHTRILLLMPEGERRAALRALTAGADAYVHLPFYDKELTLVARRLLVPAPAAAAPATDTGALSRLASEVSHAVNNPLQVLSLLGEGDVPQAHRDKLQAEVRRVRDVVDILGDFGYLGTPQKTETSLGPLLRGSLDAAVDAGTVQTTGLPPEDGPPLPVDAEQVTGAFGSALTFLAAQSSDAPVKVEGRVRTLPPQRAPGSSRPLLEAALRGRGVMLNERELADYRRTVIWSHEETRLPYPGLALADAVAAGHGGNLAVRATDEGAVLALRLPLTG